MKENGLVKEDVHNRAKWKRLLTWSNEIRLTVDGEKTDQNWTRVVNDVRRRYKAYAGRDPGLSLVLNNMRIVVKSRLIGLRREESTGKTDRVGNGAPPFQLE